MGIFLLWTLFIAAIEYQFGSKRAFHVSDNIQETKNVGGFIAEYKISHIDSSAKEILKKYKYIDILDTIDIWVEKHYIYRTRYFYFHPIEFGKKQYLIFSNPREILENQDTSLSMQIIKDELPDFGIALKGNFELIEVSSNNYKSKQIRFGKNKEEREKLGADRHNFFQRLAKVKLDKVSKEIEVWVYLPFMGFEKDDIIAGKIKLKRIDYQPKEEYKDNRNLWETFSWI